MTFQSCANRRASRAGKAGDVRKIGIGPSRMQPSAHFWASSICVQRQQILHRTIFMLQEAHGVSAAKEVLAQRT